MTALRPAPSRVADPSRTLRAAVIGTGMIARVHARSVRAAGGEVIGVLGSSGAKSADAAAAWGAPTGYADLEELLADRPDVVHVCAPNADHARYVRALLRAGVHVVCEKPLGMDAAEAGELAALAEAAGVVAAVPFVYRYHPMVREIRARRVRGDLGDLHLIHGSYLQDWMLAATAASWRVDPARGGRSRAFADIGSHWCDLVEFVTGERFADASAVTSIAHPLRPASGGATFGGGSPAEADLRPVSTEDIALAQFMTDRGTPASVVVSQVSAGRKNRLWFELDGALSSAAFDQEHAESAWFGTADGALVVRRGEGSPTPEQTAMNRLPAGHAQGWGDAFNLFVEDVHAAVRGVEVPLLPTFADGLRSARIVDAVLESARTRRWVAVGDS